MPELMLFLLMHTKEVAKSLGGMYSNRRVTVTCYRKSGLLERVAGQIFDKKLLNCHFCACAVKMMP